MQSDTIAAISTGMTNAGIGKVRLSGDDAVTIVDRIYRSPGGRKRLSDVSTHTIHYGYIYDGDCLIDEVMVLIMRGPNSYTREDVVEIDCHGGVVVMKKLLETVLKYGARLAEPGEFTKRAFLNGRIDLSQAEAVIDVINAKSDMALESSLNQLRGSVKKRIEKLRKGIIGNIAFIEAALMILNTFRQKVLAMSWLFRCAGIWQNFRKCWIPQIMAVWSRRESRLLSWESRMQESLH